MSENSDSVSSNKMVRVQKIYKIFFFGFRREKLVTSTRREQDVEGRVIVRYRSIRLKGYKGKSPRRKTIYTEEDVPMERLNR